MTAFTVWKFEDPQGAEHASSLLKDAAHDGLVKIMDHAVVSWPVGAERPTTKHGHDNTWRGTGWGFFWGLLFGMLFAVPVVGAAAGAAGGAYAKMRDGLGITDEQLDPDPHRGDRGDVGPFPRHRTGGPRSPRRTYAGRVHPSRRHQPHRGRTQHADGGRRRALTATPSYANRSTNAIRSTPSTGDQSRSGSRVNPRRW